MSDSSAAEQRHGPRGGHPGTWRLAVLALALPMLAVLVRWLFLGYTGITLEDSLISLRYAENLATGRGMVYNPGEPVFGASTPLYVLLLAALTRLGLPALLTAKILASLVDGVTLYLWSWWLLRTGGVLPAVFFGALFALSPVLVPVSVSGMETSFALLLLSLALLWDLDDRPVASGAALGLLMLIRPDGALAALVLLGMRWHRTRRPPWGAAMAAVLPVLPWLIGAWLYYGSPLPNSIPAKAAAYNLHRPSMLPNLGDTLAQVAPIRGPWGRVVQAFVLLPCLALGLRAAARAPQLRPLVLLFLTWWAYLVIPKTLLFDWYYPLLLLPAYVLAALGMGSMGGMGGETSHTSHTSHTSRTLLWVVPTVLTVGLLAWLGWTADRRRLVQGAEVAVRQRIGVWLRENTPPNARVALEPIGYIGYYSGRQVLDEVGLVSPEMIPLNRAGAGWFPVMLRRFRPDYVVERPGYLIRNLTLNSQVRMFRTAAEREGFVAEYEPVAAFNAADVPKNLVQDYRFVIYHRRDPASRRQWADQRARLTPTRREDRLIRMLIGAEAAAKPEAS